MKNYTNSGYVPMKTAKEILGCSDSNIYRLVREGRIKRVGDGYYTYSVADLEKERQEQLDAATSKYDVGKIFEFKQSKTLSFDALDKIIAAASRIKLATELLDLSYLEKEKVDTATFFDCLSLINDCVDAILADAKY
jgi:hypothetical protein